MLNRRHIRIKVLQILYAFFHSHTKDILMSERELQKSIDQSYSLYLHLLQILVDLKSAAEDKIQKGKTKLLPSHEDINPQSKFANNKILTLLSSNHSLIEKSKQHQIYWKERPEIKNKLFRKIQNSQLYVQYMSSENNTFSLDRKFICDMFIEFIAPNEDLHAFLEEKSIYWLDDFSIANLSVLKTIKSFSEQSDSFARILSLFKDKDDRKYSFDLLNKTLINSSNYKSMIAETSSNWDEDRISDMDQLLLQMAICELLNFETIPVKVTINEYIELSKDYSSQKSRGFINGIIDKLAIKFKKEGILIKLGRGLIE
ncbi:MAG: transcription antitermination factor NusB [Flavobacteriales bacterium]|nr:transcription antitermination factor NusB [Flavobacteriales bacterium]|tara:strand:+ start:4436 stop:5380 length:945 start_codon:yes stop_codon:yes gene_type:complete